MQPTIEGKGHVYELHYINYSPVTLASLMWIKTHKSSFSNRIFISGHFTLLAAKFQAKKILDLSSI